MNRIRWNQVERVDIVSGEGSGPGTVEHYTGRMTIQALRGRLTRERSGGDRWAFARVYYADCPPVRVD